MGKARFLNVEPKLHRRGENAFKGSSAWVFNFKFCVWVLTLHVCLCMCMPGAHRGQKRGVRDPETGDNRHL